MSLARKRSGAALSSLGALLLTVSAACGASSTVPNRAQSPGTDADGSPAAEVVTGHGLSIDQERQMYERIASCLRAAGFDAKANIDGVEVGGTLSPGQRGSLAQAQDTCNAKYLIHVPPPTAAEQQRLYEATIRQGGCLQKLTGYPLPPPPSAQVWMESHGGAWSPMNLVIDLLTKDGKMNQIPVAQRACPYPR